MIDPDYWDRPKAPKLDGEMPKDRVIGHRDLLSLPSCKIVFRSSQTIQRRFRDQPIRVRDLDMMYLGMLHGHDGMPLQA